ncbi:MAG: WecB/TagA/CpsF family glycosyltransferase [Atribacterota bacterium]
MDFLGFSISELEKKAIVDLLSEAVQKGRKMHLVTLNPEMLACQSRNHRFREVLKRAELLIPDGMGIIWGARFLGQTPIRRLPGIELAEALLERGRDEGWRVYLLGGKEGVAEKAAEVLCRRYPGLQIVGVHHGYCADDAQVVRAINQTAATLLLVGMGSPRQELWIDTYRDALIPSLFMGVGGSFDVWSGEKKRAPYFVRRLGFEWLWRVGSEPQRVRRVLPSFFRFGVLLLRERIQR